MQQKKKVTHMERLIKRARQKEVTLFIGSGFSYNAGAPSANVLVRHLIEDGELDYPEPYDNLALTDLSSCFVDVNGRYELMKLLEKYYKIPSRNTADHDLLASIPHFKVIYTTNYDTYIEDAYPVEKRDVITSSHGCVYSDKNKVRIYKLHGDVSTLNDPDSIVITNEDYENYFSRKSITVMWEDLVNAFRHTYVIFIGYSLYDYNIMSLVDKVREEIGYNVKGMYLIAPNIAVGREEQLRKKGIIYIQATGTDFLCKLKENIDNNIVKDFKEGKLENPMVFPEYLHSRGLDPTVSFSEKGNFVQSIAGYNGAPVKTKIFMTFQEETKRILEQRLYNTSHKIPGTNFNVPALSIEASSLIDGEVRANNVLLSAKSQWTKVLVVPQTQVLDITIKVPSAKFKEKTKLLAYNDGPDCVHLEFDIKIGKINMTMRFKDGKPIGKIDITPELNDYYPSSATALQWVEVPLALYSGQEVNFELFGLHEGKIMQPALKSFEEAKRYYELIRDLENDFDIDFKSYENYEEDNLKNAVILYSYLSKHGELYPFVKYFSCQIDTLKGTPDGNAETKNFYENKTPLVMALTYEGYTGNLNGHQFTVPYINIVMQHCIVTQYEHVKGSIYAVKLHEEDENNIIYGSDTPVLETPNGISVIGTKNSD